MVDSTEARAGCQIVFESFDFGDGTFCERFNAAVRKVLHVADDLMSRRRALREEAIADALHVTADQEATRNATRIC